MSASRPPSPGSPPATPGAPRFDAQGLPPGYPFDPAWEIAPTALRRMLEDPDPEDPALLDCREPAEWAVARIEAAELLPLGRMASRAPELAERFAPRGVVVLCHHGQRSLTAAAFLRRAGVGRAHSLAGGIDLWSRAIDPSVPRY